MENKQEDLIEEDSIFIPTEIMGGYEYSNQSYIKPPNPWWAENSYKLKFIIPVLLYILFYAAFLFLEFMA